MKQIFLIPCRSPCFQRSSYRWRQWALVFTVCLVSIEGMGTETDRQDATPLDLTEMSIEDLMNIEVTTVSRQPENRSDAPAAVYVITPEDIRHSGARTIPDLLRMVPGLQVAQIDSSKWAVTARGFNDFFSNKLLVMIDGRSVYTPLFSGVFWDAHNLVLEDIERIEVIRGPGASLWGANAVNGVINIITKHAKETQGGYINLGGGTEEQGFGAIRYGGKIGDDTYYRVYSKYSNRDDFYDASRRDAADEWNYFKSGFRIDTDISENDRLTVTGDLYLGDLGTSYLIPTQEEPFRQKIDSSDHDTEADILARWEHDLSGTSDFALQLYYDWTERNYIGFRETRDIVDLDFQHHFELHSRNDFLWGLEYRFTGDDIRNFNPIFFHPTERDSHLFSAFLQDSITLVDDRLRLILGSKVEYNDYTQFEFQPTVRMVWTPNEKHTLWGAVTRAVRTPSRADHDIFLRGYFPTTEPRNPTPFPILMQAFGSADLDSEVLYAYELGYRYMASEWFSVDLSTFYNVYDKLRSGKVLEGFIDGTDENPFLVFSFEGANVMDAETYGIEVAADSELADWWQVKLAYTFLKIQTHLASPKTILFSLPLEELLEEESPQNQFSVQSRWKLHRDVDLDLWFRYVDPLPAIDISNYFVIDTRFEWRPKKNVEVTIGAQNVLDNRHPEFGALKFIRVRPTEIESSVYASVTWTF